MAAQIVRCKFRCDSVQKRLDNYKEPRFLYTYEFSAVYDGSEENKKFFAYTPSGILKVGSFKEDHFQPSKEYYIDIVEAVPVESSTQAN